MKHGYQDQKNYAINWMELIVFHDTDENWGPDISMLIIYELAS